MEKERYVESLLSVFSLRIGKTLELPEGLSTPVMFLYDRKENLQEFRLLDRRLTEDQHRRITAWLQENVDILNLTHRLKSDFVDADNLTEATETLGSSKGGISHAGGRTARKGPVCLHP